MMTTRQLDSAPGLHRCHRRVGENKAEAGGEGGEVNGGNGAMCAGWSDPLGGAPPATAANATTTTALPAHHRLVYVCICGGEWRGTGRGGGSQPAGVGSTLCREGEWVAPPPAGSRPSRPHRPNPVTPEHPAGCVVAPAHRRARTPAHRRARSPTQTEGAGEGRAAGPAGGGYKTGNGRPAAMSRRGAHGTRSPPLPLPTRPVPSSSSTPPRHGRQPVAAVS